MAVQLKWCAISIDRFALFRHAGGIDPAYFVSVAAWVSVVVSNSTRA